MINFEFLGLELVSPRYFEYDILRKIFLTLYSIDPSNSIAWLPLFLEILGNLCIVIISFPVYDVINFGISLILALVYQAVFLNNQTNQDKNWNTLRTKIAFRVIKKAFLVIFKDLLVARNWPDWLSP